MKIGFFGDSYCADSENSLGEYSWTELIKQRYDSKHTNECVTGDTLWHAFQYLKECAVNLDFIILCVSDPTRLPNRNRIPCMPPDFETKIAEEKLKSEVKLKLFRLYNSLHTKFYDKHFYYTAQKGVLIDIDNFLKEHNKKCLVIPCFDSSMQGYVFKNAAQVNINLNQDIKIKAIKNRKYLEDGKIDHSSIANHLNKKENTVLGQAVIDFMSKDYRTGLVDFKQYFNYLDN